VVPERAFGTKFTLGGEQKLTTAMQQDSATTGPRIDSHLALILCNINPIDTLSFPTVSLGPHHMTALQP
jgi:hypothetical protein